MDNIPQPSGASFAVPSTPSNPTHPDPEFDLNHDLVGHTAVHLDDALRHAANTTSEYLTTAEHPCPTRSIDSLREAIDGIDLTQPLHSLDECIAELKDIWLNHAVWYHHPHYIAHLNCPVSASAVAGDILASVVNTAVETWDQASSAALIEQKLIRWAASTMSWDPTRSNGVFTSGGTQSNLQAMLVARNKALHLHSTHSIQSLRIFVSEDAHYSIARAAHILGLPGANVIRIPTDEHHIIDTRLLRDALTECTAAGAVPMAIVATAGTTDLGAIDPIDSIADIASDHSIHLHVDAAYGGALLVSPTQSHRLHGIDRADSVTIDFHKGFFQPVACSAVLFREGSELSRISWHADYLNPQESEELNLADFSLQTTRRFDALKLWITLRNYGCEPIGRAFDSCCETARAVACTIDHHPDMELLTLPSLSTVVFRPRDSRLDPQRLKDHLFAQGRAVIATTKIGSERWLKFTILDPTVHVADATRVLSLIEEAAESLMASNNTQ